MTLIELDNCFVQPQAILKISADSHYNSVVEAAQARFRNEDASIPVINVTLVGDEKRMLRFETKEARDERFSALHDELKKA
ncbi:hypothetical protein E4631_23320 [Hymenobacter sp. UV11]|uniref:hypothetical protein n=1 Tax=Hymenobacter sp. UV11 TaxID=1849735 RepID=UPI00105DC668|nr:hypothetical protein [Hymenobacter sp. UV11]TDN39841.1 hypothetical protein A8B98_16755 [Hymenobacter sp. UV11]TFZ63237.1 hypothetical protein E4631_23320 [Hymenobacter sp. UV11]